MSFYLWGKPDDELRLKGFSGASKGGTFTIRIEITTTDARAFGYAMGELGDVAKGQVAVKPPAKTKRLALPSPTSFDGGV